MKPVIAIDGPAGSGKSTVSRRLAKELGLRYVDTGAMYRIVGVVADEKGIDLSDASRLAKLCDGLEIAFEDRPDGVHTLVGGRDLSWEIRTAEAGQMASRVSTVPVVRERLVALQREMGVGGGVVMEGRDIGTVVFPNADLKIFLVASPEERARRRTADLGGRGEDADLAVVAREIAERDKRDQERVHSPLRAAEDAIVLDTTTDDEDKVIARVLDILRLRVNP